MSALIKFENADISNGSSTMLFNVSFSVEEGEVVYLTGKVGTGKTSILRTLIAENPLPKGEAEICGYNLRQIKRKQIPYLRRKLGVIFQDFQLLMDRNVSENLEFVLEATGWKDRAAIKARIDEVLEAVGMSSKAHKRPAQLSGGEQQRIAIARAILNSPAVILADEPTGNLDAETTDGIMQLLFKLNRENGTSILMISHNTAIFDKYPGRVLNCENETIVDHSSDEENQSGQGA